MWGNPNLWGEHITSFQLASGSLLMSSCVLGTGGRKRWLALLSWEVSESRTEFSMLIPALLKLACNCSQLLSNVSHVKNSPERIPYGFKTPVPAVWHPFPSSFSFSLSFCIPTYLYQKITLVKSWVLKITEICPNNNGQGLTRQI